MNESLYQINKKILELEKEKETIGKTIASKARTQEQYHEELSVILKKREVLIDKVREAQEVLEEHNNMISKFRQEREQELEAMFQYGYKEFKTFEKKGFKFLNVKVVNGMICPEHSRNINLFFHWLDDWRGKWMAKNKEWKMKDLADAIYRTEQDYEYDSRGR